VFYKILIFLSISVSLATYSNTLGEALLQKTSDLQKRLDAEEINKIRVFENDDLSKLNARDFTFLKERFKVYGLAPFTVSGTRLNITLGNSSDPLEIDYQNIDLSALVIKGIQYPFNLKQDLKKLYEVDFKKALKSFHKEKQAFWTLPLLPLSLSGCVESSAAATEKAVNSSSIPLAYLKLCADCISIAANPQGALVGAAGAAAQGIYAGIKEKSFKSCGVAFCKNLPGLGSFINVYNAHKKNGTSPSFEHTK
jgi:hypothetical protein